MSRRLNPLIKETFTGIGRSGEAWLQYLVYMLVQAIVLFVWWPKASLLRQLETTTVPDTLVMVVAATGLTIAYFSIRLGGEEIQLPGQYSVREWVLATRLPIGRIVLGYCGGHIVLVMHCLLLSLPLLVMAYVVAGDSWTGWPAALFFILLPALVFRLLGTVLYLSIGHREELMVIVLRVVFALGLGLVLGLFVVTAQWALIVQSFSRKTLAVNSDTLVLIGCLVGLTGLLLGILMHQLKRERRRGR